MASDGAPDDPTAAATCVARGVVVIDDLDVGEVEVAWHRPASEPAAPPGSVVVALTHGAGGTLDDPGLVALADAVAAAGHVAVRCNMPYRQRRAKGPPPRAERGVAEFAAVLAALAAARPTATGWVIGGKSYGGRLATMVAAGVDGLDRVVVTDKVPEPAGVVCYSYPLHPPGRPRQTRVDHWDTIAVPVLFLQGTSDPFGGPEELAPHLPRLGAPATVLPVTGGDHSLKVPRTRSADGATHAARDVVTGMGPDVAAWLDGVAPR